MSISDISAKDSMSLNEQVRRLMNKWTAPDGLGVYELKKLKAGLRGEGFMTQMSRDCLGEVPVLVRSHVTQSLVM